MTLCNVEGVAHGHEPTEKYHLTMLFPSVLYRTFPTTGSYFQLKSTDKPSVHLPGNKRHTKLMTNW